MSYQDRNTAITGWGRATLPMLKREISSLGIRRYSGQMLNFLANKYYRKDQKIRAVGFRMPRHAVFVQKGVGRGYPIAAVGSAPGSRAKNMASRGYKNAAIKRTIGRISNAQKMQRARKPKAWFNPIIDRQLPMLANAVAKHNADIVAKNVFIL